MAATITPESAHAPNRFPNLETAVGRLIWPTPIAAERSQHNSQDSSVHLSKAVSLFPTPRSEDSQCAGGHRGEDDTLYGMVCRPKQFTTPCADDTGHRQDRYAQGGTALSRQAGGQLSPDWVELLMGWPLGHTDVDRPCDPVIRPWDEHWEDGVPRVAKGIPHRVDRLKCIGNGQVPACAALAWNILAAR
jgi:hypothetical protein